MDSLKHEKTIMLYLTDIIGNTPNWLFPLNKERLVQLLLQEKSGEEGNDFKSIFWFAIQKMKDSGVEFFSPGGSYGRKFIYWFNSHFWEEDFKTQPFEREEYMFTQALELVKKYCTIPVNLPQDLMDNPNPAELVILGGNLGFLPRFTINQ